MAESSRRAARPAARGGTPNALFAVAAAERPPTELIGRADEVSVTFPWGSLLRGALALDEVAAAGLAALVGPAGRLIVITSIADRDRLELPSLEEPGAATDLAERWARIGLELSEIRPATADEVLSTRSTWARRLAAGRDRPTWRLELATASLTQQRTRLMTPGRILRR